MTRLEEIKKRKPFAIWDLLIYGILAAVVLILFAVFVFGGNGEAASGIQISLLDGSDTVVYSYEYDSGKKKIAEGWEERISEEEAEGVLRVTVYLDETKNDYNVVEIDLQNRKAVMRDANCSFRRDCVNMMGVSSERDVIICLPHKLKVCALGGEKEDLSHPSVG
ncbi:MAG: NusG domain II-containing protein [Clostridia bacterium]|nr:NusG domain II-containing protein [Clostridia bacterium]